MKPERIRQIRTLLDAAMERDALTRDAFIREACQGDEELLREIERLLDVEPTANGAETGPESLPPRSEGRTIGPYVVLRQLGQGGMGAVYLAVHADDPERTPVALKILRPETTTEEILRRFKREREILESLDHPNIARILGGGTTDAGLPYMVIEHVNGKPMSFATNSTWT
jgi:serine/threonine protein kinase